MPNTAVSSFFLRTKLYRPFLPEDHISRPQLLAQLEQIVHLPLTLLSAPAGYGKTTLLSAWIDQAAVPCAWLSLDEGDDELSTFLGYLVTAVRSIFPQFGEQLLAFTQAATLPPLPVINQLLVNEIDQLAQDFVVVLDDYHALTTPEIHQVLDDLLHFPPRPLHLVMLTRHDPPLPIARLRAQHQITEIRAKDLRFSRAEVASFAGRALATAPDEETVSILTDKTEGWPVGLRLATIAIRQWGITESQPAILQVENQYVVEYLVNEVLARQPTAVRDFLLKTSILDRFCPPLAAATIGKELSTLPGIEHLEREGLFIESLDGQNQWFRYHQLFRRLLQQRLEETVSAAEVAALHAGAGDWLAAHGYIEDALDHLLLGGDVPGAIKILVKHGHTLLNEERWLLMESYLHKFPEPVLHEEPLLLALWGWLNVARWRLDRVESIRHSLAARLEKAEFPPDDALFLHSSCQMFRAIKNNWGGDFESARDDVQTVLAETPHAWELMRGYAWVYLATAVSFLQGEPTAIEALQTVETNHWEDSLLTRIRKQIGFTVVYWQSANLAMVLQESAQGIKLIQNHAQTAYTSASFLHCLRGSACYQQNKLALAAEQFTAVLERRYVCQPQMVVISAIGLALVHQAHNQEEEARQVVDTAVAYCLEMAYPQLLFAARAFQAELAWRQGQMVQASHWAAQAISMPVPKVIPFPYHPFLTLPKILLAEDTPDSRQQAETVITQLADLAVSTHTIRLQMEALALQALLYQAQNKMRAAEETMVQALRLAQPGGYIRLFVDLGPKTAVLLKRLAVQGIAPAYIRQILDAFPTTQTGPHAATLPPLIESLTDRELDVLRLLAQRLSNKEIASELYIAPETVKRHTINIYQKLGVESRRQAVSKAAELGLLVDVY
ncbi:MAG TPA: LuxR C-terminal-related transcriptional regulator [Chloroflexota bacterium]|nr:LuxR C-terminal-related transcriptional regulator [Chloroflexota bacterium]